MKEYIKPPAQEERLQQILDAIPVCRNGIRN